MSSTKPWPSEHAAAPARDPQQTLRAALEARGLPASAADRLAHHLARQLADRLDGLGPEARHALIEGAVAGFALESTPEAAEEPGAAAAPPAERDVDDTQHARDLERMLGAFASELEKMDEVLEVLAAYVRRMRKRSVARVGTLH